MGIIGGNMASKLNISQQEKKVLSYWGIGAIALIVIVVIINIFFPMKNALSDLFNNKDKSDTKYSIVDDFSRYSTVSAAIEKYYSFINMKDYDSVIKILEIDYVDSNNITKDNINKYVFISSDLLSFQPNKMYQKTVKGVMTFYVDGVVKNQATGEELKKEYLKVVLDGKFHFSVRPIVESDYNEVANG